MSPRHYGTDASVRARAVVDADRACLLLAQHDPHGLFKVLLEAGALPMDERTPTRAVLHAAGRVA